MIIYALYWRYVFITIIMRLIITAGHEGKPLRPRVFLLFYDSDNRDREYPATPKLYRVKE